ncbi:mitochondrial import receptor subunit TOM40 [Coccidioides immitis H538.4]|uniref:Translocase of outer membrane 40 kDa subunit n=4 Tax=Coccidioides TaxID=5500 RepID=A0A0J8TX46_COCIT|nr:Eukaryotic porin family protein [Coccidioides posadasii C735 delta SOWgp]KMP02139.1 import receptor subunit TOM40 [Coccidioides immitis RMSCC 2394]KMU78547.1 outer membrane protein [Coccidioides immitis RMSCC 3703]KMU89247.1 mitochondrial import receptor subunit TOM40 [Coccidioides immitis H538.4]TPX24766.1 translocase of outer mitochondrial membrane [Coccidioides immitis]EER29032.1 Eukaryotic porin family protein [Coccidioides posadasii C735 delta SOWgp]|eukprot:XP_003071177.1 Eukaryotic porin family protein [Coccidioides posadasii C735 delta SOWgp]
MADFGSALNFVTDNAVASILKGAYDAFSERREALGLTNPGTVENVAREVQKDVLLSNFMFTGLRADLTKVFGVSPLFRVSHAFTMGSQGNLPPYAFSSMFGTPSVLMQGNIGSDGALNAVCNYRWTSALVTKANAQIMPGAAQGLIQIDNDYTGSDFSVSIKAFNPSFLEGGLTGIYIGSYLQSITPGLALGLEAMWQRAGLNARPETAISYCARYKGSDWIASAQLQAQGAINASYWKKLSDKVEAGVDMNLQFSPSGNPMMGGGLRKEGTTTVGAKYEFRASTFRAQIDSSGKLGCLLEKRVAMPISLTFAGEIDQVKQQAKIGLAVSFEMASEELMEQQESGDMANVAAPPF